MWVEIYDERSFTMDELIAWTQITIPKQVMSGETHEDWYPLSGKQGEGVEGMINLVMTYLVSILNPFIHLYETGIREHCRELRSRICTHSRPH